MTLSASEVVPAARPPLVFRPALHSLEEIVHALTPFYGPRCPISAVFNDNCPNESRVAARLNNVASVLRGYAGAGEPVLVIG